VESECPRCGDDLPHEEKTSVKIIVNVTNMVFIIIAFGMKFMNYIFSNSFHIVILRSTATKNPSFREKSATRNIYGFFASLRMTIKK
jgi:hypothetical protein